jgi:rhodanese-related sulfurtransferase
MGIQSGMAAECLTEAGFEQVYSFAWDTNAAEILEYLTL